MTERSRPWSLLDCKGNLLSTGDYRWFATCHVHAWRSPVRVGSLAYTSATNDATEHAQAMTPPIPADPASETPGYPGILDNEPWHHDYGTTQGKDTPMHDTSETTAAPAVATKTQYGIRRADGTIDWMTRDDRGWVTYQAPTGDSYQIATGDRFETDRAKALLRALAHYTENTAKGAGLPYSDEQAPTIVARRVTTLTDEPFTAMALGPETPDETEGLDF